MLNRTAQGLYPSGSTFRIATTLEYMKEHPDNHRDHQFDCRGVYESGGYKVKCYHSTAHGHQDSTLVFANSCNDVFSNLELDLNLGKLREIAKSLLFDSSSPVAGMSYKQGSFQIGSGVDTWEIFQTSIEQGTTRITPLHNAMIITSIVNGGTLMKPYPLSSVESAGGERIKRFMPSAYGSLMTAGETAGLTELIRVVVAEGTGPGVHTDAYMVVAKTGLAGFETGKETHTRFTGFVPAESPRLAVTVLVEKGGNGGRAVAPIARQLFDIYMSR